MEISAKLTQEKLQDILRNIYSIGQEMESLQVSEMIEEIKHQVMLATAE